MSSIYFYTPDGDRIGELQNDESVQWLENYQSPGEVKIVARVTEQNLVLLSLGMRVFNTDSDTVADICYREVSGDSEGKRYITARAVLTAQNLDKRVVMATENVNNVEAAMYAVYRKNRRDLPIEVGSASGYSETLDTEITWNSVLDAAQALAGASGLGFSVRFDPETAVETFNVYRGTDRTIDGSDDYIGYFGTDTNISNVQITNDELDYKNVAIVAGSGEGASRTVRTVSLGNFTGNARRELYVDARDLQREYQTATPTGEYDELGNPLYNYETKAYTEAEYSAVLDARGLEKLAERLVDFSIKCDVNQTDIVYGIDYFLGDRVPVNLVEYGIVASAVVSSAMLIYESGTGKRISVTLDDFKLEANYG